MEVILGILNSRWQIIKLGFQIFIFGEERDVEKKEMSGKKRVGEFAIFCKSINLVLGNFIIFGQISLCLPDIWRGKPCKRLTVHVTFVKRPT